MMNYFLFIRRTFVAVLLLSVVGALDASEGTPMTLNCMFQMEKHYWGEQYTCIGQNVTTDRYDTYITQVTGSHMPGKSMKDVRTIHFQNQKTIFIPMNMNSMFPLLSALRIESSELRYLNQSTFKDMRQLTHIHLVDNKVEVVPPFNSLQALIYLSLSGNKIRYIDSEMLIGVKNLRFFFIADNEIEVIGSSLFRNNAKLEEISFAHNRIRMIGTKLVVPITDLKLARFDGNVCTNIDLRYVPNITFKLTAEFGQKCNVVCPSRAFDSSNYELDNLLRLNLKLKTQTTSARNEKQSLRYNCERINRIVKY